MTRMPADEPDANDATTATFRALLDNPERAKALNTLVTNEYENYLYRLIDGIQKIAPEIDTRLDIDPVFDGEFSWSDLAELLHNEF